MLEFKFFLNVVNMVSCGVLIQYYEIICAMFQANYKILLYTFLFPYYCILLKHPLFFYQYLFHHLKVLMKVYWNRNVLLTSLHNSSLLDFFVFLFSPYCWIHFHQIRVSISISKGICPSRNIIVWSIYGWSMHTHTQVCVCVCVYIYIYIYI